MPAPGTPESYTNVLLEEVRAQMGVVIESVQGSERAIRRDMEERFHETNQRLGAVEAAVRINSQDISGLKSSVTELKSSVTELKSSVTELKVTVTELSAKFDSLDRRTGRVEGRVDALEGRVDALEA